MESGYLILRRVSAFRPSGEWNDDDFDVLGRRFHGRPHHEGGGSAGGTVLDVDARIRISQGPHADARLRGDAPGRDGSDVIRLAPLPNNLLAVSFIVFG
jgi:hypothetical protein